MAKLDVAYKSQFDEDAKRAKGDCMETCLAMVAGYVLGRNFTTDRVVELAGSNLMGTTTPELLMAADKLGLPLDYHYNGNIEKVRGWLNEGKPVIAIINYERIGSRQDLNYKGGHSVVIIGVEGDNYIINDPDHWGNRRHSDTISKAEFEGAWHSTSGKNIEKNGSVFVPTQGKSKPNTGGIGKALASVLGSCLLGKKWEAPPDLYNLPEAEFIKAIKNSEEYNLRLGDIGSALLGKTWGLPSDWKGISEAELRKRVMASEEYKEKQKVDPCAEIRQELQVRTEERDTEATAHSHFANRVLELTEEMKQDREDTKRLMENSAGVLVVKETRIKQLESQVKDLTAELKVWKQVKLLLLTLKNAVEGILGRLVRRFKHD